MGGRNGNGSQQARAQLGGDKRGIDMDLQLRKPAAVDCRRCFGVSSSPICLCSPVDGAPEGLTLQAPVKCPCRKIGALLTVNRCFLDWHRLLAFASLSQELTGNWARASPPKQAMFLSDRSETASQF